MMKELENIFIECEFNPTKIGIKLLKQQGYKIDTFNYSESIYVYDKQNQEKLRYWKSE